VGRAETCIISYTADLHCFWDLEHSAHLIDEGYVFQLESKHSMNQVRVQPRYFLVGLECLFSSELVFVQKNKQENELVHTPCLAHSGA
jgi:hypothetical protein